MQRKLFEEVGKEAVKSLCSFASGVCGFCACLPETLNFKSQDLTLNNAGKLSQRVVSPYYFVLLMAAPILVTSRFLSSCMSGASTAPG